MLVCLRPALRIFHPCSKQYNDHVSSTAEQLLSIDQPFHDNVVSEIILGGFPDQFKPLILEIQGSQQGTTVKFVQTPLMQDGVKILAATSEDSLLRSQKQRRPSSKEKVVSVTANELAQGFRTVQFDEIGCKIVDESIEIDPAGCLLGTATKVNNMYRLDSKHVCMVATYSTI